MTEPLKTTKLIETEIYGCPKCGKEDTCKDTIIICMQWHQIKECPHTNGWYYGIGSKMASDGGKAFRIWRSCDDCGVEQRTEAISKETLEMCWDLTEKEREPTE